ncbi:MAG: hypothetical protein KAJ35_06325, partial [Thermoplasmata archaeon]|nr:hypothetical protein [Thermoplasmata archaeon]
MRALLGVHNGRIYFMAADDKADVDGYRLYSFNITSFRWTKVHIFDLNHENQGTQMIMKDEMIYCLQVRYAGMGRNATLELFTFDLYSQERTGPTHLLTVPSNYWGSARFFVDPMGDIHLLRRNFNLTKYS